MNSTSVMKSGIIFGGTLVVFLGFALAGIARDEPDIIAEEDYHRVVLEETQGVVEAQTVVRALKRPQRVARNLKEPRADLLVR